MIIRFLRSLSQDFKSTNHRIPGQPRVLNVGGNDRRIPIPPYYTGWEHVLLDIDPGVGADIVCDARELGSRPAAEFDAVYCSHNLEHYYRHDCRKVLHGFLHVLRADGFAEIHVPDLKAVIQRTVDASLDLEDVLYQAPVGPITVRDVIYGLGKEIEASGRDYFAHKTGFTPNSLYKLLREIGFVDVFVSVAPEAFEIRAYAFRRAPSRQQRELLSLVGDPS